MAQITWDAVGERIYETGTDRGVYYPRDRTTGEYEGGVPWNGLTSVTESPSGAEPEKHYADNIEYATITSAEEFAATIEAFTWPEEFDSSDGVLQPVPGLSVGQQSRRPFGFSYRTKIGNDTAGEDFGYKIHLIYSASAAPSEKAYATVSDSTEPTTFSWELTTSRVPVGTVEGVEYAPTATLTINSTKFEATALAALEEELYGTETKSARLPLPAEVITILGGTVTTQGFGGGGQQSMAIPPGESMDLQNFGDTSEDDEYDTQDTTTYN